MNTKTNTLKRLAAARVPKAIHKIELVGNLSRYKPTPAQVDKIMAELTRACDLVEQELRFPHLRYIQGAFRGRKAAAVYRDVLPEGL